MPDIMARLGREMLVFEGAMGTMLQRAGMQPGECPELLNIIEPDMVRSIHNSYYLVGADCSTSNTFCGSRTKLAEFGLEDQVREINRAGVRIARQGGAPHTLADIGPTGMVMQPLGPARFEEVFEVFVEQAMALAEESPDAFALETFTDINELRCAVLACKQAAPNIPVIACATFGMSGRMDLSGTDPRTAAIVLEAAGADAVGMNCGLGPDQMIGLAREMVAATNLPVIAQPNAGLPYLDAQGTTVFPGTPDEMAAFAVAAREAGVAAVGSCCGSSPMFTGAIADEIRYKDCIEVQKDLDGLIVAGPRRNVRFGDDGVRVIGERINPTGKKELKESLLAGSMAVVRRYATEQEQAGADVLDVNVGAAGVDAVAVLPEAVKALVGATDCPLVLDTTDPAALEAALKIYPGKALINSVNGDPESYEAVLPLAEKYGAALVVLTLDEQGIPASAQGRVAIAEKVRAIANNMGIKDQDLIVDSLVMTAATDKLAPSVTLEATEAVGEIGLATMLGVSNVSHGLPIRPALNAGFLRAAGSIGLAAAIVNPNDQVMMEAVRAVNAERLNQTIDKQRAFAEFESILEQAHNQAAAGVTESVPAEQTYRDPEVGLRQAIATGDTDGAPDLVDKLIEQGLAPATIIGDVLTPAIQSLGDKYGRGEVFLPQLMVAADAMKSAVNRAKSYLDADDAAAAAKGTVVFATVKGDIHSIGKDICISLLESQGFNVVNLGVDVALDTVVESAHQHSADVVCLSALMTTTLPSMQDTARAVSESLNIPVFVGGAVVTQEWADSINAKYTSDAPSLAVAVQNIVGGLA